jgi:exopolyphosphatase/guanosine-5'-triphosphate,3'-diphosphate pyrophosphatase
VLLHRSHDSEAIPRLDLAAYDDRLDLIVSKRWIDSRPLLRSDLVGEPDDMQGLGVAFKPFVA